MLQVYVGVQSDMYACALGYGGGLGVPMTNASVTVGEAVAAMTLHAPHLEAAADLTQSANCSDENQRKRRLVQEFNAWSSRYPIRLRPTLQWCSPMDVVVFLNDWRSHRVGRWRGAAAGEDGSVGGASSPPIAPSTLRATASRLSALCGMLGRHGPWTPNSPQGNPCLHPHVQRYLDGYARRAFETHGYSETSAVPLGLEKYMQLMGYLTRQIESSDDCYRRTLLLRDQAAFSYLWECGPRGLEVCDLLITDVRYHSLTCTPVWSDLVGDGLQEGVPVLSESTGGTKTRKMRYPGVVTLATSVQADGSGMFLPVLRAYALSAVQNGTPLKRWMIRPGYTGPGDRGLFREEALGSNALQQRLRRHLEAMGAYSGESLHSFRRGRTQHSRAAGATVAELMERHLWSCEASVRLYLHPLRHERRLPHAGDGATTGTGQLDTGAEQC